ncbi:type VII secretion integral membrane protein EccD [Dactylosporangium siamense]|uniref:Type VII secretion integral membrane protein EccD n=1 Tax=Dactylosporangium siamense TaxID=685454 RepID=A0A919PMQ1_9ACTN|nr:type VII secretion integral membrane protein EccD [Dactylosporangium siamense]GIG46654.1 type VII secretion integral membrane protein EccD [Dactylosporangium siamense]
MSATPTTGLARVTVVTPDRRVDLALPTNVALAGLLPSLLQHAGESFADDGEQHGGWMLRRSDGAELVTQDTLGAQEVHDGELLHLVPRHEEWPEVDYDDIVHTIAAGSRRYGQPWSPATTRRATMLVGAAALAVVMVILLRSGPSWTLPGWVAAGLAVVLLITGVALSRAMADAQTGVFVAAISLPFAFTGGALLIAGDTALTDLGAPHLLLASVLLTGASLVGYAGVADSARLFVAGVTTGLIGMCGAVLVLLGLDAVPATSAVLAAVVLIAPASPLLAIRLGKIPVPALPENAGAVFEDQPYVPAPRVFAAVARADEILTGVLLGASVAGSVCLAVLGTVGGLSVLLLATVAALALLLRTRLFLATRQRVPLLVAGLVGVASLVVHLSTGMNPDTRVIVTAVGLAVVAGLVIGGGVAYSKRSPSPYIGRFLEMFDAFVLISVIPIACAAASVYSAVRGHFG